MSNEDKSDPFHAGSYDYEGWETWAKQEAEQNKQSEDTACSYFKTGHGLGLGEWVPPQVLPPAELEAMFEAQRLRPKDTVFTAVPDAQQYLREVIAAHPLLLIAIHPSDCKKVYDYQNKPLEDTDVAMRLSNNDVVWFANWVFAWLDRKLLTCDSRKCLESVRTRMRQGHHLQVVEVVLMIINEAQNIITRIDKIDQYTRMLMCMTAVNEGSYDSLEHILKLMKAETDENISSDEVDEDLNSNTIVNKVSEALHSRGDTAVLNRFYDKGLVQGEYPPRVGDNADDFRTSLKSITAQRLVEAMCHQLDTSKRCGVPWVKGILQRLPADVVRRYVVPHVPANRSDIFYVLYYEVRVVSTEAYLDSLMEARNRRNFMSFGRHREPTTHLPYHESQIHRFSVQVFGGDDEDALPLPITFVPREHSTIDHTNLHMYAEVNPRWTCRDAAELSQMRCIVPREEFEMNFLALTGMELCRMKLHENGFVIAGGSLVLSLLPLLPPDATLEERRAYYHTHYPTADVDIFPTSTSQFGLNHGMLTNFFGHLHKDVFGGEDMLVTSSRRLITIVRRSTHVVIQISYGDWHEPLDAVENADMDCAGVYYSDHTGVRMTLRAHLAFTHRMNITRQEMWFSRGSPAYESRLCRYAKRGFSVVDGYMPKSGEIIEFMDAEIDRWVAEHPKLEAQCNRGAILRGAIRVRAFSRNALPLDIHYPSNMCLVGDARPSDNIQHVIDTIVGRETEQPKSNNTDGVVGEDDSYGVVNWPRVNERNKIVAMSLKWCSTSQHHETDSSEVTEKTFFRTLIVSISGSTRVELEEHRVGRWQHHISFGSEKGAEVTALLGKSAMISGA